MVFHYFKYACQNPTVKFFCEAPCVRLVTLTLEIYYIFPSQSGKLSANFTFGELADIL